MSSIMTVPDPATVLSIPGDPPRSTDVTVNPVGRMSVKLTSINRSGEDASNGFWIVKVKVASSPGATTRGFIVLKNSP